MMCLHENTIIRFPYVLDTQQPAIYLAEKEGMVSFSAQTETASIAT